MRASTGPRHAINANCHGFFFTSTSNSSIPYRPNRTSLAPLPASTFSRGPSDSVQLRERHHLSQAGREGVGSCDRGSESQIAYVHPMTNNTVTDHRAQGSERTTFNPPNCSAHFPRPQEEKKGGAPLHDQAPISAVGAPCEKKNGMFVTLLFGVKKYLHLRRLP